MFDKVDYTIIRDVLDDFYSMSGQSVNVIKSRVYFSPYVDRDTRESLYDILGFATTPSLSKFLGFPIKHSGISSNEFNFILDRVKHKLAGWKANMLSLGGCIILIQVFLAAISSYVIQCANMPGRILEGIDRVNKNFLWGSLDTT